MDFTDCTWEQFKNAVTNQIQDGEKRFIYRGQSDSAWRLKTSIHRTGQWKTTEDISLYVDEIVPLVHESVAAWEGRRRDLRSPFELAQFIAYLQHNGFPTPLLDWTFSPYIAAFFAFDGIDHFKPQCNHVCVYAFNALLWAQTYTQSYDYKDPKPHVSVLEPSFFGNPKQMLQQGIFLYTNLEDIESHISANERDKGPFLYKYRLSCKERVLALRELRLMNITAMQLYPCLESVCKKVATDISLRFPVGKSRSDINKELFASLFNNPTAPAALPNSADTEMANPLPGFRPRRSP
ncbi:MAG TPA: FRG domain-containing protein [Thermoanaerobaculia bacterium]|nr:FRG domain-containing protein [Thermoanaerobaculia bacterium]